MSENVRDVSDIYELARFAANGFQVGEWPDVSSHMRAAYMHGFAAAMLRVIDTGLVPQDQLIAVLFTKAPSGGAGG